MKTIFAILLSAIAGSSILAQEPTATPVPAPTQVVTPKSAETPAAVEKPASRIVEPMAKCDLGIVNSPIIHGLKLGMGEMEAALKVRGQFAKDAGDPSTSRVSAKFDRDAVFENVESASLSSVDGRVTSIKLNYSTKWPTVKDFVWDFGPKLGLIRIGFRLDEERKEAKTVCKEFTVDMRASDTGSELVITDIRNRSAAVPPKTQ